MADDLDPAGAVVLEDARAIKALAHPARLIAVERLFGPGAATATATELAAEAGVTPSAMSYHLRALARHKVVERAEADGDSRERPWRAGGERLVVRSSAASGPASRAAVDLLVDGMLARLREGLAGLSARAETDEPAWRVGGLTPAHAHLTAEETQRLQREVLELLERYSALHPTPVAGTRPVQVLVGVVPQAGPPA